MPKQCPDCSAYSDDKKEKCKCGFVFGKIKTESDWKCEFRYMGRRCPLDGTVSDGSTHWYCYEHWRNRNERGQKYLKFLLDNPSEVIKIKRSRRPITVQVDCMDHMLNDDGSIDVEYYKERCKSLTENSVYGSKIYKPK